MSSKVIKNKSYKTTKILIERFFVDPVESASWVLMYEPEEVNPALEMSRLNIQYHLGDKPTKFYFDIPSDQKMWVLTEYNSLMLIEVHLRKVEDIEIIAKR